MADERGGYKAVDMTLWRDSLHAATAVGRMAGARRAVELGYGIAADAGRSGKLGHWAIDGVPAEVMKLFSKRARQIDQALTDAGHHSYRARQVAARATRTPAHPEPLEQLRNRWLAELRALGYEAADVAALVTEAAVRRAGRRDTLGRGATEALVAELVAPGGALAGRRAFSRSDVIVAAAPALHGMEPRQLDRVVDATLASPRVLPLPRVGVAREPVFAVNGLGGTTSASGPR